MCATARARIELFATAVAANTAPPAAVNFAPPAAANTATPATVEQLQL